jgi:hypothetical protein
MSVFVACRLILAGTFLVSASGKFVGGGDALGNALRLSVPRFLAGVAAMTVTPLEFVAVALLLFGNARTFEVGLVAAAGLLMLFSGWMFSVLLRDLRLQCSCFGPQGAAVGWRKVLRNAVLIGVAVTGLLTVPSDGGGGIGSSVWSGLALAGVAVLITFGVAVRVASPTFLLSMEQLGDAVNQQEGDAYAG